jgi:hypothetical protein
MSVSSTFMLPRLALLGYACPTALDPPERSSTMTGSGYSECICVWYAGLRVPKPRWLCVTVLQPLGMCVCARCLVMAKGSIFEPPM